MSSRVTPPKTLVTAAGSNVTSLNKGATCWDHGSIGSPSSSSWVLGCVIYSREAIIRASPKTCSKSPSSDAVKSGCRPISTALELGTSFPDNNCSLGLTSLETKIGLSPLHHSTTYSMPKSRTNLTVVDGNFLNTRILCCPTSSGLNASEDSLNSPKVRRYSIASRHILPQQSLLLGVFSHSVSQIYLAPWE